MDRRKMPLVASQYVVVVPVRIHSDCTQLVARDADSCVRPKMPKEPPTAESFSQFAHLRTSAFCLNLVADVWGNIFTEHSNMVWFW